MDKLKDLAVVSRLRSLVHAERGGKGISVYALWRLTFALSFCFAAAITFLAWISYGWAIKEAELQFTRPNRETFSIDELRSVIEMYQKKEEEHASLHQSRPTAPVPDIVAAN